MRKIPALLLLFIVTSCFNQANCLITSTNLVKVTLKKLTDNTPATITFNSITIEGTSLISTSSTPTSALRLPVNPATTETTFILNYNEVVNGVTTSKSSTLTLSYTNEIVVISEDCGAYQYQKNLAIVNTDFTKTKLINSSLLTTVTSNLEIYF